MKNNRESLGMPERTIWELLKNGIVTVALLATLSVAPTVSSAQEPNIPKKQKEKVVVKETPNEEKPDSSITWNEGVSGQNLESELGKISAEEVLKYIKRNENGINDFVDKKTKEAVYEELMRNEKLKSFLEEMVNRKDIRDAALKGDKKYIQQEVVKSIYDYGLGRFLLGAGVLTLLIIFFRFSARVGKKDNKG